MLRLQKKKNEQFSDESQSDEDSVARRRFRSELAQFDSDAEMKIPVQETQKAKNGFTSARSGQPRQRPNAVHIKCPNCRNLCGFRDGAPTKSNCTECGQQLRFNPNRYRFRKRLWLLSILILLGTAVFGLVQFMPQLLTMLRSLMHRFM